MSFHDLKTNKGNPLDKLEVSGISFNTIKAIEDTPLVNITPHSIRKV